MQKAEGTQIRPTTPTEVMLAGNYTLKQIVEKVKFVLGLEVLELSSGGDKHRVLLFNKYFEELSDENYLNLPFLQAIAQREKECLSVTTLKSNICADVEVKRISPKNVTVEDGKIIFSALCSDTMFYACTWSFGGYFGG